MAIPDLSQLGESERAQPPTYVPNRNMMLLSLAAAYAESKGATDVFYGAQQQDEYGYWDCTEEFLKKMNEVLSLNRGLPVRLHAPFMRMKKSEVLRAGLEMGVDYSRTWSCYRGGETPCRECPTCVERAKAFAVLDVPDPLGRIRQRADE